VVAAPCVVLRAPPLDVGGDDGRKLAMTHPPILPETHGSVRPFVNGVVPAGEHASARGARV
jgi:hypothetical protein